MVGSIKVTGPSGKTGDIHIVDMEPRVDALREPTIRYNTILLEERYGQSLLFLTCLDVPMQISVKNDSLFLAPKDLTEAVKFAPYN